MTVAQQAPLSMGFSRQEYWSEWVAISSSRVCIVDLVIESGTSESLRGKDLEYQRE